MDENIQRGWDFSNKILGGNIAVDISEVYVKAVNNEIEKLTNDMLSLQTRSGSTDASLSGFVSEYWHAQTFNINAVAQHSEHRAYTLGSTEYGSVDVATNFGKNYGLKYLKNAEKSVKAQASYSRESGIPKYLGQERLIPTDQLNKGKEIANKEYIRNIDIRPEVSQSYKETYVRLTDRVNDSEGVESIPLSKEESMNQARDIKDGSYNPENYGVTLDNTIKAQQIVKDAIDTGLSTAMVTIAIQIAPEIYKAIDYLIKNKEIDIHQLKTIGVKTISSGAEGFLRGFISYSLLIMCREGKFGPNLKQISPLGLASTVAILLETVKNGIMVALGKMTVKDMGNRFVDGVITTTGYITGAKIGGAIGQALGFELPIFGYILGSLIGCAFCATYNFGKKKLISFCKDTGFTCFGLVEQDYIIPEEILKKIGINIVPINRINISRTNINNVKIGTSITKSNYETIDIKLVRRGVVGINKIGYLL